jgi:hypothetical protein
MEDIIVGRMFAGICIMAIILFGIYNLVKFLSNRTSIVLGTYNKIPSRTFKKNKYKNYCGVEIECLDKGKSINTKELKEFNVLSGRDLSLSEDGVEFKLKPSNGDRLLSMINGFGELLNKKGYKVDTSCGLHIHIETKPELELLKKLYCFYSKYEGLFFAMLPSSRQNSKYCERFFKVDKYDWKELINIKTLQKFKNIFYEKFPRRQRDYHDDKRYCWANFHSIFYRGTLEIRAHSGTISPEKIINWIMIHLAVREYLEKNSLETIVKNDLSKTAFLKIFKKEIRNYIKERWKQFPQTSEVNFREYV